jgi:hypothetical protein
MQGDGSRQEKMKGLIPVLIVLALMVAAAGQATEFYPLSAVRPGLKGVGKTVFEGTRVDTFDVEVLGVLEKTGPNQNLILARLSGEQVDRYGVFAGMSGSPVYIDGKLLGAIAYAFSFATAPIAGITPIQEMVDVFRELPGATLRLGQARDPRQLHEVSAALNLPAPVLEAFTPGDSFPALKSYGRLEPILTPLGLQGFVAGAVSSFAPQLASAGLIPVLGSGKGYGDSWADAPVEPGSTIAVQLVRGDMEVAASGTVTHISGNRIYAFGHPFLSIGYTDFPLTKAAVLGVIPSLMNSQKISASLEPFGVIRQDRATGILGLKDEKPKMIPVKVRLDSSRGESRRLSYEVITDPLLTPFLLAFTVNNTIVASERSVGGQTQTSATAAAAVAAAAPLSYLLTSGFEDVNVESVEISVSASEEAREAVLEKVWQDRDEARPGEEVLLTVFLRRPNGAIESARYPVKIPDGLPAGPLKIMVGDGVTISRIDAQTEDAEFIPKDVNQLVRAINLLKKNDRLYIRLFREQEGAVVAGQGLPGLPPSILALYNSRRTKGDIQPINLVVFVEHELPQTNYVVTGQKVIEIKVKG